MIDKAQSVALAPKRLSHPWHGINPEAQEGRLIAYVENTRHDQMKLEVDLHTGYLKVDYPLQTSALPPFAYGFIPRTLCGRRLAGLSSSARGDQAPLDIFVVSEHPIPMAGVLVEVRVVGGIGVEDSSCVDDKLIGLLHRDPSFAGHEDIDDLPISIVERISHFLQQTALDGSTQIGMPFGAKRAGEVLTAAFADYKARYEQG